MAARAPRAPQHVVPVAAPSRRAKIAVAAPVESGRKRVIPEGASDEQKRLFRNAVITAKRHGSTIDEANAIALAEVFGTPKAGKAAKTKAVAPVAPAAPTAPKAPRSSRKAPEAEVAEKPKARRSKASASDVPGEHTFVLTIIGLESTKVISAASFEEIVEKFNKN